MKKSLIVAGILLAGSTLVANDGYYVGFDIGKSKGYINYGINFPDYPQYNENGSSHGDGSNTQTIKLGKYIDSNNRAGMYYMNVDTDGESAKSYGLTYDYLIGENQLKPFLGAIVGYVSYETNELEIINLPDVKIDGMLYGVQAGLNYEANKNISFEAGYRYLKSNADYKGNSSMYGIDYSVNADIDKVTGWYIGLNYKF